MDLSDWATLAFVLLALWTFLPRPLRAALRRGLEPAVIALSDLIRVGIHHALRAIKFAAYRWLVGVDVPGEEWHITSSRVGGEAREPVRASAEPPDTAAARTSSTGAIVPPVPAPSISHKMSDAELIVLLSVQKGDAGYRYSANKIADFVGGTRADVLAQIRAVREGPPAEPYRDLDEQRRPVLN
jgi:hypothetical protein